MTNLEKYKNEIKDMLMVNNGRIPLLVNKNESEYRGKISICDGKKGYNSDCSNCELYFKDDKGCSQHFIEWLAKRDKNDNDMDYNLTNIEVLQSKLKLSVLNNQFFPMRKTQGEFFYCNQHGYVVYLHLFDEDCKCDNCEFYLKSGINNVTQCIKRFIDFLSFPATSEKKSEKKNENKKITNSEKWKDKLANYITSRIAVVDGKPVLCDNCQCENCDFNNDSDSYNINCSKQFLEWLNESSDKNDSVNIILNVDKYRDDIYKVIQEHNYFSFNKKTKKVDNCGHIDCGNCAFSDKLWEEECSWSALKWLFQKYEMERKC